MTKKEMTLEEKLKEAIVKDIPYEVPENWIWSNIKSINKRVSKSINPSSVNDEIFEVYSVPSYDYDFPEMLCSDEIKSSKLVVKKDEVLLCKINPRINRVWKVGNFSEYRKIASSEWIVINPNNIIFSDYLCYVLKSPYFRGLLCSNVSGVGGSLTRARPKEVDEYPVPIPPLKEQIRIINKIESLFEKLDKAKELIEETRDDFEKRKSAILEKAIRGELTKEWRNEKGITKAYKEYALKDLLKPMTNKKPDISKEYFRYIDIDSINNKKQVVGIPKVIETIKAPSRASREVRNGDVLFSTVRPYLKNIACITEDLEDCIASTGFYICRCKELIDPKFLYRLLCSDTTLNYYTSLMKGDNSPSIRKGEFEGLVINLPSLEEQKEIVRILDKILEEESKIEELTSLEEQIEIIKKSVLAKAFRGKLGTNCEDDESALEILKEILSKE